LQIADCRLKKKEFKSAICNLQSAIQTEAAGYYPGLSIILQAVITPLRFVPLEKICMMKYDEERI
jgi:hypothetical protein